VSEAIVSLRGVTRRFPNGTVALRGVSADVAPGETLVVLGPSGSGKSTLLRCINGLDPIAEGEIVVDAIHVSHDTTDWNKVRAEVRGRAASLLARVGLAGKEGRLPAALSGGEKQRVAIARALAMDPKVMLFDEPTSSLDPEMILEVLEVMRDLARGGMTMLVVTHELAFARDVAQRALFLDGGVLIEAGPAARLIDAPETERCRAFMSRIRR
jgi:ABC-type polar amino acid transport system ATPase subunit